MAERTALDIVSLENAKHQLGIPPSVDTEDSRITGHVKSAASYVSGETGIPLLPERINWEIRSFPSGKQPIDIPFTYIDSILKIAYWLPDGDFTQEPTHFVTGANLGRLREYSKDTHSGYYVYPPTGGWPQHLSGSGAVIVEIVRCVSSVPDGIAEAVILAMRDFYEGQREPAGAIRTILEPWMDAAQPQIAERMRRYALDGSSAIRITERSTGTGGDITPVAGTHLVQQGSEYSRDDSRINLALNDGTFVRVPLANLITQIIEQAGDVKADGTVAFTQPIAGVAPVDDAHLSTKGYVDEGVTAVENVAKANTGFLSTFSARVRDVVEAIVPAWARQAMAPEGVGQATEDEFGTVKLAREVDVADSETDLSRVPTITRAIALIRRLVNENVRSIPEAEASHVGRPLVATEARRPWGAWAQLGTEGYADESITEAKLDAATKTKLNASSEAGTDQTARDAAAAAAAAAATADGKAVAAQNTADAANTRANDNTREVRTARAEAQAADAKAVTAQATADAANTLTRKVSLLTLYVDPGVVEQQAPATRVDAITGNYRVVITPPDVLAGEDVWVRIFARGRPLNNARVKMDVRPAPQFVIPFAIDRTTATNIHDNDPGGDSIDIEAHFYSSDADAGLFETRTIGVDIVQTPRVDDKQPLLPNLGNDQIWISRGRGAVAEAIQTIATPVIIVSNIASYDAAQNRFEDSSGNAVVVPNGSIVTLTQAVYNAAVADADFTPNPAAVFLTR